MAQTKKVDLDDFDRKVKSEKWLVALLCIGAGAIVTACTVYTFIHSLWGGVWSGVFIQTTLGLGFTLYSFAPWCINRLPSFTFGNTILAFTAWYTVEQFFSTQAGILAGALCAGLTLIAHGLSRIHLLNHAQNPDRLR